MSCNIICGGKIKEFVYAGIGAKKISSRLSFGFLDDFCISLCKYKVISKKSSGFKCVLMPILNTISLKKYLADFFSVFVC